MTCAKFAAIVGRMSSSELITTQEAAKLLGVSVRQVARLVPSKLAPKVKAPGPRGAFMFDPADVEQIRTERAS